MLLRATLLLAIACGLALPLRDVLRYPDRVSVLPNLQTDADAYYSIGNAISQQRSLDAFPVRHPPVWIALLALTFGLVGTSFVAGKIISWVALCISVAAGAWLARRMFGSTAGWIAAVLIATSPALRGYVGTVQYEVFTGTVLVVLVILALRTIESSDRDRWRSALAVGLVGGLLILTRETFAVVVPLLSLWIFHRIGATGSRWSSARTAFLVTCIAIAPAAAWSAMQSIRTGALVTISEKGPIVIELGHNTRANGTYNAPLVGIGPPTGLAFVLENPGREVVLSLRKVLYFWGVLRDGWNVPRPAALWMWRATTGLVPFEVFGVLARGGWLLVAFVTAIVMLGPEGRARWWGIPGIVLLLMIVHIITLSSHRFAVPALPLVFVLVSGPLAVLTAHLRGALRSRMIAAASAVLLTIAIAMQFQDWPLAMHMRAVDLDGLLADNVPDDIAQHTVRVADGSRGVRPVVLLSDHFFARGTIRVHVAARRLSEALNTALPSVRVSLVDLDGDVVCATDVSAAELTPDRFAPIALMCRLSDDKVATLAVFSLGVVDVAFDELSLDWVQ